MLRHYEARAYYGYHRAGRILPRGIAAGKRLRGPRYKAPLKRFQYRTDRSYLRGLAPKGLSPFSPFRGSFRFSQLVALALRGETRRDLQPCGTEPRAGEL